MSIEIGSLCKLKSYYGDETHPSCKPFILTQIISCPNITFGGTVPVFKYIGYNIEGTQVNVMISENYVEVLV